MSYTLYKKFNTPFLVPCIRDSKYLFTFRNNFGATYRQKYKNSFVSFLHFYFQYKSEVYG